MFEYKSKDHTHAYMNKHMGFYWAFVCFIGSTLSRRQTGQVDV